MLMFDTLPSRRCRARNGPSQDARPEQLEPFSGPDCDSNNEKQDTQPIRSVFDSTKLESCCVSRHQPTPTPPWPQAPHRRNQTPACSCSASPLLLGPYRQCQCPLSAPHPAPATVPVQVLFRALHPSSPPDHRSSSASPYPKHHITSPLSLERPRFPPFLPSNPRSSSRSVRTWSPFALGPLGCVSGCPMRTSGGSSLSVSV